MHARKAGISSSRDFMDDMQRQLQNKLKVHTDRVVDEAFARASGGRLSRAEFKRWADSQPKMFTWLTELGKKWTHSLQRSGSGSSSSEFRRTFNNINLQDVQSMVRQVVRGKSMSERDIESVLDRLRIKNNMLKRRILSAFRDRNGDMATGAFSLGSAHGR
jgi:hypothetical protein